MRETQATDIQKRIREDVTRYRYGDEQHLEEVWLVEGLGLSWREGAAPASLPPQAPPGRGKGTTTRSRALSPESQSGFLWEKVAHSFTRGPAVLWLPPPPPPKQGGERPMGTTADGGKGSKGRAANGDRPVGAASRRREQYTEATCQPPPPPPTYCGVHYLWFAFVCFLIRSHPPGVFSSRQAAGCSFRPCR